MPVETVQATSAAPTDCHAEALFAKDELPRFRAMLIETGAADEDIVASIETEGRRLVDDAISYSRQSPDPDMAGALATVFSESEAV